ncbi:trypsin inhibitor [Echinococcus multilocularis]|uniref:Trypsin inhibitor n=1 Tax=Echinococcus multilocularis TaxID=6211 RepID=A0A068Y467_ECHMU|nr:trypsin inhibitor [Echinococcus multilocularis]
MFRTLHASLSIIFFAFFVASMLNLGCCRGKMSYINRCNLPISSGRCRGYFLRYGYDSKTDECRRFVYGGCRGNRNNFFTYKECMKRCYLRFK